MPPDTAKYPWESIIRIVTVAVAGLGIAGFLYGCISVPGKKVYWHPERGE
jgi:hypothetical protein